MVDFQCNRKGHKDENILNEIVPGHLTSSFSKFHILWFQIDTARRDTLCNLNA